MTRIVWFFLLLLAFVSTGFAQTDELQKRSQLQEKKILDLEKEVTGLKRELGSL